MSIPLSTTTISVLRAPDRSLVDPEDYDDDDFAVVTTGVRAVIAVGGGAYVGREGTAPGPSTETTIWQLVCDPVDLTHLDRVLDETSGTVYRVQWAISHPGVAGRLASVKAGLLTMKD